MAQPRGAFCSAQDVSLLALDKASNVTDAQQNCPSSGQLLGQRDSCSARRESCLRRQLFSLGSHHATPRSPRLVEVEHMNGNASVVKHEKEVESKETSKTSANS